MDRLDENVKEEADGVQNSLGKPQHIIYSSLPIFIVKTAGVLFFSFRLTP
jgi:hypothetical protein